MPNPEKPAPEISITLDPREVVALDAQDRYRQAFEVMREALTNLVICPAFTGKLFESDRESHRAWTLARAVLRVAERVK